MGPEQESLRLSPTKTHMGSNCWLNLIAYRNSAFHRYSRHPVLSHQTTLKLVDLDRQNHT